MDNACHHRAKPAATDAHSPVRQRQWRQRLSFLGTVRSLSAAALGATLIALAPLPSHAQEAGKAAKKSLPVVYRDKAMNLFEDRAKQYLKAEALGFLRSSFPGAEPVLDFFFPSSGGSSIDYDKIDLLVRDAIGDAFKANNTRWTSAHAKGLMTKLYEAMAAANAHGSGVENTTSIDQKLRALADVRAELIQYMDEYNTIVFDDDDVATRVFAHYLALADGAIEAQRFIYNKAVAEEEVDRTRQAKRLRWVEYVELMRTINNMVVTTTSARWGNHHRLSFPMIGDSSSLRLSRAMYTKWFALKRCLTVGNTDCNAESMAAWIKQESLVDPRCDAGDIKTEDAYHGLVDGKASDEKSWSMGQRGESGYLWFRNGPHPIETFDEFIQTIPAEFRPRESAQYWMPMERLRMFDYTAVRGGAYTDYKATVGTHWLCPQPVARNFARSTFSYNLGVDALARGQRVEAMGQFDAAIKAHPRAAAYLQRGLINQQNGYAVSALDDLTAAIDSQPIPLDRAMLPDALFARATLYEREYKSDFPRGGGNPADDRLNALNDFRGFVDEIERSGAGGKHQRLRRARARIAALETDLARDRFRSGMDSFGKGYMASAVDDLNVAIDMDPVRLRPALLADALFTRGTLHETESRSDVALYPGAEGRERHRRRALGDFRRFVAVVGGAETAGDQQQRLTEAQTKIAALERALGIGSTAGGGDLFDREGSGGDAAGTSEAPSTTNRDIFSTGADTGVKTANVPRGLPPPNSGSRDIFSNDPDRGAVGAGARDERSRCAERGQLRSSTSGDPAKLWLINESEGVLMIYWIDADGAESGPLFQLAPGADVMVPTFVGHYYTLADTERGCVAVAQANQATSTITFARR